MRVSSAAVPAALCLLFAGVLTAVETQAAGPLDLLLNAALDPLRTPAVLAGFLWITTVGTEASRLALAVAASALLWSEGHGRGLRQLWVTVLGSEATVWAIKFLVDRPRPVFLPGVASAVSPSFPSAHAAGTMAAMGALALIVAKRRPDHRFRIGLVAVALIAAVGFSRLALNVHFPTDVAAGFLIGAFWLWLGAQDAGRR